MAGLVMFMSFRLDRREQQKNMPTGGRRRAAGKQAGGQLAWQTLDSPTPRPNRRSVSWGGGGGRERDGGPLGTALSNRQAETTARSVRSEEGTLQKQGTRDGTQTAVRGGGFG